MNIKLNTQSIIILFLLGFCIIFFSLWYLKGTGYKKDYRKLELEFEKIQKSRDSIQKLNLKLKKEFDQRELEIKKRDSLIRIVEKELEKTKLELKQAKKDVAVWEANYQKTKKKIEDLKKDPIKREDDDLIKSLTEKLK